MTGRHSWTKEDDIIALYLYKYGNKEINNTYDNISKKLGMSKGSLSMKRKVYKHLDNKPGLCDGSKQITKVFELYKRIDRKMYKEIVEKLLTCKGCIIRNQ